MATTYVLNFPTLRTVNELDGMTDVIQEIHWGIMATTDGSPSIEVYTNGSVALNVPTVETFIPRASVTVDDVHGWFAAKLDSDGNNMLASVKAAVDAKIARIKNPIEVLETPDQTFLDGVAV